MLGKTDNNLLNDTSHSSKSKSTFTIYRENNFSKINTKKSNLYPDKIGSFNLNNWFYTLKNKSTNDYLPNIIKNLNKYVTFSQPYYYDKKVDDIWTTCFAQRYQFIKSDDEYKKYIQYLEYNNCLFEVFTNNVPVKPYFDIEIEKNNIKKLECHNLLYKFIDIIMYEYEHIFNIIIDIDDIVIIDGCRENKLSYHIIINNGNYFKNNKEQKIFIEYLFNKFSNIHSYQNQYKDFYEIFKKDIQSLTWIKTNIKGLEQRKFIFDPIPYSSIQNFRLPNQSKFSINKTQQSLHIVSDHKIEDCLIRLFNPNKNKRLNVKYIDKCKDKIINKVIVSSKKEKYVSNSVLSLEAHNTNNIITTGLTLYDKYNMTIPMLKSLKDYQQFLYLIPSQISYGIWIAIGFSIASCGGIQKDWEDYSKLNESCYKNGECDRFNSFKKEGCTYGISYLKKLAKLCNPDKYKELVCSVIDEYFSLDISGMNIIEENSDYISCTYNEFSGKHELNNNIMTKDKFIILQAFMGKGKTQCIQKFLVKQQYKSILFLSPRISFSYFIQGEFNCDIYLDTFNSNNLVCQIESLCKITLKQYDCIIIDESESVLKQFSSSTMKKPLSTWITFEKLIRNAKKVICADAFITRRTIDMCKNVKNDKEQITFLKNTSMPIKRIAKEIKESKMEDNILDDLENNKKIYCCYSSKSSLCELEKAFTTLQKRANFKEKKAIFYHALKSDELDKTLKNIGAEWIIDMIGTSPKITVGCSFSVLHFDHAYINAKSTCCVRDTFQTLMRVRHLKDNIVYFSLPDGRGQHKYVKKLSDILNKYVESNIHKRKLICNSLLYLRKIHKDDTIERHKVERMINIFKINNKYKNMNNDDDCNSDSDSDSDTEIEIETDEELYNDMLNKELPIGLNDILFFNTYEETLSKTHYNQMFVEFLKKCNYDIYLLKKNQK